LHDVCTASDGTVWAAGEVGTLGRLNGNTWVPESLASTEALRHLACCATGVVAVGMNGAVVRVREGRVIETSLAGRETLTGVSCLGGAAVVSSAAGAVWVETGDSFVRRATPHPAFAVHSVGPSLLISGPLGIISSTQDQGRTWHPVWEGEGRNVLSFAGDASDLVGVGAGGLAVRSRDAGATWSLTETGVLTDLLRVRRNAAGVFLAVSGTTFLQMSGRARAFSQQPRLSQSFSGIASTRTEWVAVGTGGSIARGRATLSVGARPFHEAVLDTWFDGQVRIAVGEQGWLARSTTPTGPLRVVRVPTSEALNAVTGNARGILLAVGHRGTVLRSTNGGARWTAIPMGDVEWPFNAVWIDDEGHALCVGERGLRYRSDDSGLTWQSLSVGRDEHFSAVAFSAGSLWTIAGGGRRLERSTDFGRTWTVEVAPAPDLIMRELVITATGTLVVTALPGRIFTRRPAGSWVAAEVTSELLTGVASHASGLIAVSARGGIFHSGDEGRTWTAERPFTNEVLTFVRPGPDGRLFVGGSRGLLAWREPESGRPRSPGATRR
jgi:photosystem II stability/assembly factor-like uncharacterized protein